MSQWHQNGISWIQWGQGSSLISPQGKGTGSLTSYRGHAIPMGLLRLSGSATFREWTKNQGDLSRVPWFGRGFRVQSASSPLPGLIFPWTTLPLPILLLPYFSLPQNAMLPTGGKHTIQGSCGTRFWCWGPAGTKTFPPHAECLSAHF